MNIDSIPAGKHFPKDIYAIIEIPAHSMPVKYETHRPSRALFVDRFLSTSMLYPCNYGYVNRTVASDGDPTDILVPTPHPLHFHTVIRCRLVGMLTMFDECGSDNKLVAVPHDSVTPDYASIREVHDLPLSFLNRIRHFFENYKCFEPDKWVKIGSWKSAQDATNEIVHAHRRCASQTSIRRRK